MTQIIINKSVTRAMNFDTQDVTLNLAIGCMEIRNVYWIAILVKINTAWKVSKYGVFSGSYFLVFGLNTEIYEVNLRI